MGRLLRGRAALPLPCGIADASPVRLGSAEARAVAGALASAEKEAKASALCDAQQESAHALLCAYHPGALF